MNPIKIKAYGVEKTYKEWSDISGISLDVLKQRIGRGWPVTDALTLPVDKRFTPKGIKRKPRTTHVEAFGQRKTIKEWAELTGVSAQTIACRLNVYKVKPEIAITSKRVREWTPEKREGKVKKT